MLPKLPYTRKKVRQQNSPFLGLNMGENTRPGELRDSLGLSSRQYPNLIQRQGRQPITGYSQPEDLFSWDGKLVVVDDGILYYDGQPVDNVSSGEKQFCVVGSKLCVFPDKRYLDLTNGHFGALDAKMTTQNVAGSAVFTDSSMTVALNPKLMENTRQSGGWAGDGVDYDFYVYVYGKDKDAVSACYKNGAWDMAALEKLESIGGVFGTVGEVDLLRKYQDYIIIPEVGGNSFGVVANFTDRGLPDKSKYNQQGYYCVLSSISNNIDDNNRYHVHFYLDVYKAGTDGPALSEAFKAGDVLTISGSAYGFCDVERRIVTALDDETNTLSFVEGTFLAPEYVCLVDYTVPAASEYPYQMDISGYDTYYLFTLKQPLQKGQVVYLNPGPGDQVYVWDPETKKTVASHKISKTETYQPSFRKLHLKSYAQMEQTVTISRDFPDLDYVCESNNRLWGVSNRQNNEIYDPQTGQYKTYTSRCIYASSLGDPTNFYNFSGRDTDSYQVAVASEGDFTGICSYGGVICWKENSLHKIMGSYPSEYYMVSQQVPGVQKASSRSLVNIHDTLYYKGVTGVYAYSGNTPTYISQNFGTRQLYRAVGGSDGRQYYLAAEDEGGKHLLLVYDLQTGLWMKEDEIPVQAFASSDGSLYMLSSPTIYKLGEDSQEHIGWMAEFVPFVQTDFVKQGYTKLLLRLDMEAGSHFQIEVKQDGGLWRQVWTQRATQKKTLTIPLRLGRADRFYLRISGFGPVTLRTMAQEFSAGSEV